MLAGMTARTIGETGDRAAKAPPAPLPCRAVQRAMVGDGTVLDIDTLHLCRSTMKPMNSSGYSHNPSVITRSSRASVARRSSTGRSMRCWDLALLHREYIISRRSNPHESATPSPRKIPPILAGLCPHDLRNSSAGTRRRGE
jgi:hypothetical protein